MKKRVQLLYCDACIVAENYHEWSADLRPGVCACCGCRIVLDNGKALICEGCVDVGWYLCEFCGNPQNDSKEETCCEQKKEELFTTRRKGEEK